MTVGVTRSDGTEVLAAGTATTGATTNPRTIALTVSQTALLDVLTAVWKVGATTVAVTVHDIVGGFYFTTADLRDGEPSTADAGRDPNAKILLARSEVESVFEAHGRPAFVPRFTVERITSYRANGRQTLTGWPLRTIRWVRQWYGYQTNPSYLDYTATELAGIFIDPVTDGAVFPSTFFGYPSVQIGYEYGFDAPPPDVKAAALTYARACVNRHRFGVSDRALSMTTPDGANLQFGRVGTKWRPTGIEAVDEVLTRPEFHRPSIGGA